MALPAKRVPESVAHLDVEIVAAALIRSDANIGNAARALGVPSGDLRKLVLIDQRLADAALEAVELRLDDAEANLHEALHCDDPRLRVDVSKFMLRNTQSAAKRGYAVAASAASLEVSLGDKAEPRHITFSWLGEGERETETFERDGQTFEVPKYGKRDDIIEGELSKPRTLIEHDAPEPEPAPVVPVEPPLPAWPGPYPPPALVAHLFAPFVAKPQGRPPQPIQPRKVIYE